jgi:hypothetical protein
MPISVESANKGLGAIYRCIGNLEASHFSDANNRLLQHPERIRKLKYVIIDASAMEPFYFAPSDMDRIVQQDQQMAALAAPGLVIALVARKEAVFGLARMWEAFVSGIGWNTNSFSSVTDAQAWVRLKVKDTFNVDLI